MELIQYLTIDPTFKHHHQDINNVRDDEKVYDSENSNNVLIKDECYFNSDLRCIVNKYFCEIFSNNLEYPNYEKIRTWSEIAYKIAKQDNEQNLFEESKEYFDKLYDRTYLRVFLKDAKINITLFNEYDYQNAVVEIVNILNNFDFFERFSVDIGCFKSKLMEMLEFSPSRINTEIVIQYIESAYVLTDYGKLLEQKI